MTGFSDFLTGFDRFRAGDWAEARERWGELAGGQKPRVMVIACSDSRVDPATLFDTAPGEIFVVRNVANLVPPYAEGGSAHGTLAALEYAVTQLEVSDVVVMGHSACGGVKASLTQVFAGAAPGDGGLVAQWVDLLDGARERVVAEHGDGEDGATALEHEGVRVSLANIRSYPFVREREADGRLTLHGAWFSIPDGNLQMMGADGDFAPVPSGKLPA